MNATVAKTIGHPLLPLLPRFQQKGAMLYHAPSTGVLRGIYLEDSGFDKEAFYVWTFFLPLYVPAAHVSFTFGKRLVEGKRWKMDAIGDNLKEAVRDEALPFLNRAETAADFAEIVGEIAESPRDPYVIQGRAYSLAKADDRIAAIAELKELVTVLQGMNGLPWVSEMLGRTQKFMKQLAEAPAQAKQSLTDWETTTRKNLRLA